MYLFPNDLCADVRFQNMRLANVSDSKQQTEQSISQANHGVPREQQSSGSLFGPRQFRKY